MQVASTDEAARWDSIVRLAHDMNVRTTDRLFQQLMAEENLMKKVRITGLLRSNQTYDVAAVTFFEGTPAPLVRAQSALDAERRAALAASRAEAAAERVGKAMQRLEAAANNAEDKFDTRLKK